MFMRCATHTLSLVAGFRFVRRNFWVKHEAAADIEVKNMMLPALEAHNLTNTTIFH